MIKVLFGTNCSGTSCFTNSPADWVFTRGRDGANSLAFIDRPVIGTGRNVTTSVSVASVHEPGTLALAGRAVAGLGLPEPPASGQLNACGQRTAKHPVAPARSMTMPRSAGPRRFIPARRKT